MEEQDGGEMGGAQAAFSQKLRVNMSESRVTGALSSFSALSLSPVFSAPTTIPLLCTFTLLLPSLLSSREGAR